MNAHDSTHAEACRLARAAQAARAKGDEQTATKLETKALTMVGALMGPSRRQAARQRILGRGAAALVALVMLALPGAAQAETKAPRPTVCVEYRILEGDGMVVGMCVDGKRPKMLRSWKLVDLADSEGKVSRFMVGFP